MVKRLFILFLLTLGLKATASAQLTALVIQKADGTVVTFELSERPQLYFQGSSIVIKTATKEVELSSDVKFDVNFSDATTAIEAMTADSRPRLEAGMMILSGEKPQSAVSVYTLSGRLCTQTQTDAQGRAVISLDALTNGIYLIQTTTTTHKFTKR